MRRPRRAHLPNRGQLRSRIEAALVLVDLDHFKRSAQDRVIVESTVGLAHNQGLNVVADEAGRWMQTSPLALQ